MGKQRRSYSAEFKVEAVRATIAGDPSLTRVARDLGISASLLQNWKQRILEENDELAGCRTETLEQENRRLRRENASLREDREILKKAAVDSADDCSIASSVSAGVRYDKVLRGRPFRRRATALRSP